MAPRCSAESGAAATLFEQLLAVLRGMFMWKNSGRDFNKSVCAHMQCKSFLSAPPQ